MITVGLLSRAEAWEWEGDCAKHREPDHDIGMVCGHVLYSYPKKDTFQGTKNWVVYRVPKNSTFVGNT